MPLYEYQCDACGRRFELIRKFSDPPLDACPTCGGAVRKLVSSPAFQFKGSGFYITDYPKKDQAGPGKTDKSDKADGAKTDSSKTEPAKTDTAKSSGEAAGEKKADKTDRAAKSTPSAGSTTSTTPSAKKD
jgi:putative FmdB family regulatory protein